MNYIILIIIKLFLLINYKDFINSNISIKRINKTNPLKYVIGFHYSLKNINNFFNYIISVTRTNSDYIKNNLKYIKNIKKIQMKGLKRKNILKEENECSCMKMSPLIGLDCELPSE